MNVFDENEPVTSNQTYELSLRDSVIEEIASILQERIEDKDKYLRIISIL